MPGRVRSQTRSSAATSANTKPGSSALTSTGSWRAHSARRARSTSITGCTATAGLAHSGRCAARPTPLLANHPRPRRFRAHRCRRFIWVSITGGIPSVSAASHAWPSAVPACSPRPAFAVATASKTPADCAGQRTQFGRSGPLPAVGRRCQRHRLQVAARCPRRELAVSGGEYLPLTLPVHMQLPDFDCAADRLRSGRRQSGRSSRYAPPRTLGLGRVLGTVHVADGRFGRHDHRGRCLVAGDPGSLRCRRPCRPHS